MQRLTIEDLKRIRDGRKEEFILRGGGYRGKVTVHMGTCGIAAGARAIMDALLDEMGKAELSDIVVTASGCAGHCSREPLATVEMEDHAPFQYCDLNDEKIREIVREHVLGGSPLAHYSLQGGDEITH